MPTIHAKPPTVAILLFPGVKLLDAIGPLQVFADARLNGAQAYRTMLVSLEGGSVPTDAGVRIPTEALNTPLTEELDTLLVSGGPGVFAAAKSETYTTELAQTARRVRRLGSICTGAFVLAAGGHLDGRKATTHWAHCKALAESHPSVDVRADAIYVEDGPVWTSAGVTTGIDMALAMVEADMGRDEALRLARSLVLYVKRPGGQEQFSAPLRAQFEGAGALAPVLAHIRNQPTEDLSIARLAALSGMSRRTFARRFEAEIGGSPSRYVERVRVDVACEVFCSGVTSVKRVASIAGFGSEERMRRAFQRVKGVAPSEYRDRFANGRT